MTAHRLSAIVNVNKIIVVDNGKVIEQGSHKELLGLNGKYKKCGIYIQNLRKSRRSKWVSYFCK